MGMSLFLSLISFWAVKCGLKPHVNLRPSSCCVLDPFHSCLLEAYKEPGLEVAMQARKLFKIVNYSLS